KDVQHILAQADVCTKRSTFLPAGYAQIDLPDQLEIPSTQRNVTIHTATVFAGLTDGVKVSELVRQIAGLMVLYGTALMADNFLEGDDVRADLIEHARDAFDARSAVETQSLVDVVCRYA